MYTCEYDHYNRQRARAIDGRVLAASKTVGVFLYAGHSPPTLLTGMPAVGISAGLQTRGLLALRNSSLPSGPVQPAALNEHNSHEPAHACARIQPRKRHTRSLAAHAALWQLSTLRCAALHCGGNLAAGAERAARPFTHPSMLATRCMHAAYILHSLRVQQYTVPLLP